MRKLKLQMQMTVDGFVARPGGELDWTTNFDKDARLGTFVDELVDSSDTLLLGRKLTPGFIGHWENVARQPNTLEYHFAQKMVRIPKIVFSKTMHRDGGAAFVSSLIQYNPIDELNFFINTVAIGEGLRIFAASKGLTLQRSTAYPSGIVVNTYGPN